MRERFLEAFDTIRIDNLNGDKYKTGKTTPDGKPDPSIFSMPGDPVGIQVGTAIATLVRKAEHAPAESVGFTTTAALVHELMEARDERRLLNLQRQLSRLSLLIIDELGFVPLSPTGAELLFEVFSQGYERGSILVTTNLPFDEWTEVFGSERLTGALLDRLTHHVHILEMNGESYRLKRSREGVASQTQDKPHEE